MKNKLTIDEKFVDLITSGKMDKVLFLEILHSCDIENPDKIKEDLIDVFLSVVYNIVEDKKITNEEIIQAKNLKTIFEIREGDLYQSSKDIIQIILCLQVSHFMVDGKLSDEEEIENVNFQELFDLGYDQYLEMYNKCFTNHVIKKAVKNIKIRNLFKNHLK